jgi:hypothetical protein
MWDYLRSVRFFIVGVLLLEKDELVFNASFFRIGVIDLVSLARFSLDPED